MLWEECETSPSAGPALGNDVPSLHLTIPAPVDMVNINIPSFTGFHTCQVVVRHFFFQQYVWNNPLWGINSMFESFFLGESFWNNPCRILLGNQSKRHQPKLPSGKLTWQWNIPVFNRKYIFKGSNVHCYVRLPEGNKKPSATSSSSSPPVGILQDPAPNLLKLHWT